MGECELAFGNPGSQSKVRAITNSESLECICKDLVLAGGAVGLLGLSKMGRNRSLEIIAKQERV